MIFEAAFLFFSTYLYFHENFFLPSKENLYFCVKFFNYVNFAQAALVLQSPGDHGCVQQEGALVAAGPQDLGHAEEQEGGEVEVDAKEWAEGEDGQELKDFASLSCRCGESGI